MVESIAPLRVLVVANKRWEVDPLVSVLLERKARPASARTATLDWHPSLASASAAPRRRATLRYGATVDRTRDPPAAFHPVWIEAEVHVWCIEDAMRTKAGSYEISSSSSREKATFALPAIAAATHDSKFDPQLVLAFGTAGIDARTPMNGCVTLGSRVFVSDPFRDARAEVRRPPGRPEETWMLDLDPAAKGTVLESFRLNAKFLGPDRDAMRRTCEGLMLRAPLNPAPAPLVLMGNGFTSVGTVNVTSYDDYVWADPDTIAQFRSATPLSEIGSIETTHGLIRLAFRDTPFLFVSGITDGLGMFDHEVGPRSYAQNFVAAHNAGVVVAHLVPELMTAHALGKLFT